MADYAPLRGANPPYPKASRMSSMLAIRQRRHRRAPIVTDRSAPTAQVGLTVTRETYARLDRLAWDRRLTKAELVRWIVLRWLDELER